MSERKSDVIDLRVVFGFIMKQKKLYFITLPIVFFVSCALILCVPRYYSTNMCLAPEAEKQISGGALSSIASSLGFDLDNLQTNDAIYPMLYPDLMDDNGFVSQLFNIRVKTQDGSIDTDYFTYLKKHQKAPWWAKLRSAVMSWIVKPEQPTNANSEKQFDPYSMSKYEDDVAGAIRNKVKFGYDKKTGVISISVEDQDPLICKTIADSVSTHLQNFITSYRTNKARVDVDYYEMMAEEAKKDYEEIRFRHSRFADANTNVVLHSVQSQLEDLENDMQMKFNAYTTFNAQLQNAKARLQERTPAFTILKGAAIPIRPIGPKRVIFVAAMLCLAFFAVTFYIMKDYIIQVIKQSEN